MDTSTYDTPETPAPVFAFRAFKHAIFGTPKPGETERKPRRRELDSRNGSASPDKDSRLPRRPLLAHSKSSTALASPAKGILLTPGTANNRRKTVSFGSREQVQAAIAKEAKEKATPKEIPGRFPTPYTTKQQVNDAPNDNKNNPFPTHPTSSAPKRTLASDHDSLSQRFKRLSTDARSLNQGVTKQTTTAMANAGPFDIWVDEAEAQAAGIASHASRADSVPPMEKNKENKAPEAGDYWKNEYEAYATRSTREMKKLVKKEQVARKYAKDKDRELLQCQELLVKERDGSRELRDKAKRFEADLAAMRKENERLRKELQNLQASTSVKVKHSAERLKASIQEGRDAIEAESRPSSSKGRLDREKNVISSNIWADSLLAGHSERGAPPRRRPSKDSLKQEPVSGARRVKQDQPPSASNEAAEPPAALPDVGHVPQSTRDTRMSKTEKPDSGMSDERREAARKRLEERKKSRAIVAH